MNKKSIFFIFFLLLFSFLLGNILIFQEGIETNTNYSTINDEPERIDSITVGENKEYDVFNTLTVPEKVFHIKYNFTNRVEISETDEIEYTMDISITNKINTKKTSHLYAKVEEANGEAGHFYYNEQIPFSLGFNDE